MLRKFWQDTDGATAIEYAFIAMLISVLIVAGSTIMGTNLARIFNNVSNGFS